jgi:hypothetical protein
MSYVGKGVNFPLGHRSGREREKERVGVQKRGAASTDVGAYAYPSVNAVCDIVGQTGKALHLCEKAVLRRG